MGALRKGWLVGLAALMAAEAGWANSPAPAPPPLPGAQSFASMRAGASPWVLAVITRLQAFWDKADYPGARRYLAQLAASPGFARRSRAEQQTVRTLLALTDAMTPKLDAADAARP